MARKDALPRFGQRRQNCFWRKASTGESRAYLSAEMLKTLLLWQKNEAVPQTQYGKRGSGSQTEVLPKLLRDGLSSCISGSFLPFSPRLDTLLLGLMRHQLGSTAGCASAPNYRPLRQR